MLKIALEVLEMIEFNGFECYLVGGFVRDYYIGVESNDIDICTSAKSKDLLRIFPNSKVPKEIYGAVTLFYKDIRFEITTFRKELRYENRKPIELEYTKNFEEDIKRRDFTMNSLCMNSKGEIIDILDGKKDIDNKIIKSINNVDKSFRDDPLRILRAIRFSSQLDFELDKEIYKNIKKNKKYLEKISYNRKMEELDKIFASKNSKKGIDLIRKISISKELKLYNINKLVYTNEIIGFWVQLDRDNVFEYTVQDKKSIAEIRKILKIKRVTNKELYEYGLYICSIAGQILNIDKEKLLELNKNLPIRSKKDINITSEKICELLDKEPGPWMKLLYDDLINKILNQKIENNTDILKTYIKTKYK